MSQSESPEAIQLTVERLAHGGDAIAHLPDGRIVFVDAGIPGDVVEVELVQSRKKFARARMLRRISAAADAAESGCVHSERCGGCRFQRLSYEDELTSKTAAAAEAMTRIARGVELPAARVVAAVASSGVRDRARFGCGDASPGFRERGSSRVVAIDACPMLSNGLRDAGAALADFCNAVGATECSVEWDHQRSGIVALVHVKRIDPERARRAVHLLPTTALDIVLADRLQRFVLRGTGVVHRLMLDAPEIVAKCAAGSFAQSGARNAETLIAEVVRLAEVEPGQRLLELFAGSGALSFPLARAGAWVHAVEGEGAAVGAAMKALASTESLPAGGLTFTGADLSEGLPQELRRHSGAPANAPVAGEGFDTLVCDPPRSGLSRGLIDDICALEVRRLIYVSCDPGTQARDLSLFAARGWTVREHVFVDMFPRTAHIESLLLLTR